MVAEPGPVAPDGRRTILVAVEDGGPGVARDRASQGLRALLPGPGVGPAGPGHGHRPRSGAGGRARPPERRQVWAEERRRRGRPFHHRRCPVGARTTDVMAEERRGRCAAEAGGPPVGRRLRGSRWSSRRSPWRACARPIGDPLRQSRSRWCPRRTNRRRPSPAVCRLHLPAHRARARSGNPVDRRWRTVQAERRARQVVRPLLYSATGPTRSRFGRACTTAISRQRSFRSRRDHRRHRHHRAWSRSTSTSAFGATGRRAVLAVAQVVYTIDRLPRAPVGVRSRSTASRPTSRADGQPEPVRSPTSPR